MLAIGLILTTYILLVLLALKNWSKIEAKYSGGSKPPATSLIVPFRNEVANLPHLVKCLEQQSHPDFEVIFVNDHSTDAGAEWLNNYCATENSVFRLIHLHEQTGKKAAIEKGVEAAKNEIVVTTDADCSMSSNWLKTVAAPFGLGQVQMVLGPVMLSGECLWQKMQSIEFSALIGATKVMTDYGKPSMANGANLAYRKAAFNEVGGFDNINTTPSGDDELLLQKVQMKHPKGVVFCALPEVLVTTAAAPNWQVFREQRLRWASKWKENKRKNTIVAALGIVLVQCATLSIPILPVLTNSTGSWLWGVLLAKLLAEFLFIRKVRKAYAFKTPFPYFLLCFIVYPFYAIYFGLAANFRKFEWKGRTYSP